MSSHQNDNDPAQQSPPLQDNNNYDEGTDLFGNASSLDHALLESLFYSEMMHLNDSDDPNVLSHQLLSTLTADGAVVEAPAAAATEESSAAMAADSNVAAEQDLLHHFGVNHSSSDSGSSSEVPSQQHQDAPQQDTQARKPPAQRSIPLKSPERQASSLTASLAPELLPVVPPAAAAAAAHTVTTNPPAAAASAHTAQPRPVSHHYPHSAPLPVAAAAAVMAAPTEEEKRSKLVNQFATLASRLGISLPNNVLQSLSQVADSITTTTNNTPVPSPSPAGGAATAAAPQVQRLAATAEAAIASVGRKRTRSESPPQPHGNTSSTAAAAAAGGGAAKRRKKPRLNECEHKLSELKAENAMLKRHLANVSAQSHQLDQERKAQEQRMRQMATSGSTTEEELNEAIQTFQDMYSDYGRRRHDELTFHLDQLLRLANPTNFTKMGLWTMGQQSKNNRNPIASILQKELGITSQQGRKIVEQREKIRRVCDNMKETLRLLTQLKALCEQKTKIFHDRMTKCREILKPSQVIKCLVWIDKNSETLSKLCPGWGSEQMVTGGGSKS